MRLRLRDRSFVVEEVPVQLVRILVQRFAATRAGENRVIVRPWYIGALQAMYRDSLITEEPVESWLRKATTREAFERRLSPHIRSYKGGYQVDPMLRALTARTFGIYLDVGAGKTQFALEIAKQLGPLVLITQPLIWVNAYLGTRRKPGDWTRFYSRALPRIVDTTFVRGAEDRRALLSSRADIYVISCYALGEMESWIRDLPAATIVVDESDNMRSPDTRIAQVLHSLSDRFPNRYLLSANPAPNDCGEFWAQMEFIVPGLLGPYSEFCAEYGQKMRHGWVFRDESKAAAVLEKVKPYVAMLTKSDFWPDAPPLRIHPVAVELTNEQARIYREMEADQQIRIDGGTIEASNDTAQEMKLRQISAGFVYGRRGEPKLIGSMPAKMAMLKNLLQRIMVEQRTIRGRRVLVGKQVIIWTHFRAEMQLLERMLARWRISYVIVHGQNRSSAAALNDFLAGRVRVMISHTDSVGHGIRAENCNQMIFMTPDYSARAFYQAIGRIHRPPQSNPCDVYILIGRDTVDMRPWKVLQRKIKWTAEMQQKLGGPSNAAKG